MRVVKHGYVKMLTTPVPSTHRVRVRSGAYPNTVPNNKNGLVADTSGYETTLFLLVKGLNN